MTIYEAKKILEHNIWESFTPSGISTNEAIKLGIEALKRIQDQRNQYPEISSRPLPGETGGD